MLVWGKISDSNKLIQSPRKGCFPWYKIVTLDVGYDPPSRLYICYQKWLKTGEGGLHKFVWKWNSKSRKTILFWLARKETPERLKNLVKKWNYIVSDALQYL